MTKTINFSGSTPKDEILKYSMALWLEENLTKTGKIKSKWERLLILRDGKKTGWFVGRETYIVVDGVGMFTTPYAKIDCFGGFHDKHTLEISTDEI